MSKKLLVVILSVVGVLALAACEKKSAPAPVAAEAPAVSMPTPAAEAPAAPVAPAAPAAEAPAIDKK